MMEALRITTVALAFSLASSVALAQAPPRTRGVIVAVAADHLTLRTHAGPVTLRLSPQTGFVGARRATLSAVTAGTFIGTAAVPQPDGSLKALEITVFPESMRGTGEGHYGWDLGQGSSMTNGTVGGGPVVGPVVGTAGRTMTVDYQGGRKQLTVPADVPVVGLEPGTQSLARPGAHVVAFGPRAADGSVDVKRIIIGEDATVPPM